MAGTVPIVIELDENAPIKSLAQLHRITGLAKIHFNFDVFDKPRAARREMLGLPAPAPKANGHHQLSDKFSPSTALIEMLTAHGGPMSRREIQAAGGERGIQMVNAVTWMEKHGKLKKKVGIDPPTYDLADRSTVSSPTKARNGAPPTKKTGREIVLEALAKNGRMSKADFKVPFDLAGRSYGSLGDIITKLLKSKEIKKPERNVYTLA